ncbi:protein of unknown function [Candidatus Hydrogenisulfobacillus filiaventi]|uniref:Uncharacterized protein n=1 Tax=Candidatus Hydrogenisulfobacillus filiaventi TaxID=2707344 RepID=A0A6F8ZHN5_9FIRM|nr:protein of unknown function [Candidatus Hydrogenisulfobacillus filiaventi]
MTSARGRRYHHRKPRPRNAMTGKRRGGARAQESRRMVRAGGLVPRIPPGAQAETGPRVREYASRHPAVTRDRCVGSG